MRFDTADKKPKLYLLLAVSAVYAAAVAAMMIWGGKGMGLPISVLSIVYLCAATALLLRALLGQLRYNPYSYNTIYYIGFSLFVLSMIVTHLLALVQMAGGGDETVSLGVFLNSAKVYMLYSAPFIAAFSVMLFVSNVSLLRHERKRFVNVLAMLAAVLMVAGEVFLFFVDRYASGSQREVMFHDLAVNLFACLYLYFECMVIGAIAANVIVVRYTPDRDKDYLIVAGCGLRRDGSLTPLLRGRCDRALAFYRRQQEETGKPPVLILSGGRGADEPRSEAEAMKEYVLSRGVPEQMTVVEDASRDTLENMRNSKAIIDARGGGKTAFATTNYHVFRAGLCARRVKLRAQGIGARTKWYFWPNAAVREFLGLVTAHRLKQAAVFGGMVVFYALLTFLYYR